jgi:hypothetical protein
MMPEGTGQLPYFFMVHTWICFSVIYPLGQPQNLSDAQNSSLHNGATEMGNSYIPISLEVHLEPASCIVYEENYLLDPSSWQVGRVCLKMQERVASSPVSHMLLSWIWHASSSWTLRWMPIWQTSLTRTRLTSWVQGQTVEKSRKVKYYNFIDHKLVTWQSATNIYFLLSYHLFITA